MADENKDKCELAKPDNADTHLKVMDSPKIASESDKLASEDIHLKVVDSKNNEIHFNLKKTTKLQKVIQAYCDSKKLHPNLLRFMFDGERISGDNTPEDLEMEDDNMIDVVEEQTGGNVSHKMIH